MDYYPLGCHPPQLASSPSLMSADVRSPVVGVVRSRSLFESIVVTPEHFLPSSASSSPLYASATFSTSDQSNGPQEQGFMSSAMSTSTTDLMEFCSPSKKHRPDAGHQNKTTLHQKRKWDSVDDDEEEEVGEEEELNDSSDDEDEAHTDLRQQHRPREERSSTVIVSFPASPEMDKSAKHQRVVQKKPDARDIPRARHIILRFCDSQQSVRNVFPSATQHSILPTDGFLPPAGGGEDRVQGTVGRSRGGPRGAARSQPVDWNALLGSVHRHREPHHQHSRPGGHASMLVQRWRPPSALWEQQITSTSSAVCTFCSSLAKHAWRPRDSFNMQC